MLRFLGEGKSEVELISPTQPGPTKKGKQQMQWLGGVQQ